MSEIINNFFNPEGVTLWKLYTLEDYLFFGGLLDFAQKMCYHILRKYILRCNLFWGERRHGGYTKFFFIGGILCLTLP